MPGIYHTVTLYDIAHWPKSDYDSPVNRTWLPGFSLAWCAVSTVLVWGRLYLRLQNKSGRFGGDDASIFVAWVFSLGMTALACESVWFYHVGRHVWDVRPEYYTPALKLSWLAQLMFLFSTGATKTSVLLFYCRMLKDIRSRVWIYSGYILLAITCGSWIGVFIAYMRMCQPLNVFWTYWKLEALGQTHFKCINGDDLTIAIGTITIASDFWTAALPCALCQFHDLGVSKRQKIALNFIFCLGFIVTGVGAARTYYLWRIGHDIDLSWMGYNLGAVSVVECQLGIICACMPFIRAFWRQYVPEIVTITSRTRSKLSASVEMTNSSDVTATTTTSDRNSYLKLPSSINMTSPLEEPVWENKTGCLVREEGSRRLVWSAKNPKAGQRISQWLSPEPMECV